MDQEKFEKLKGEILRMPWQDAVASRAELNSQRPPHSEDCSIHGCEGRNGDRFCDCLQECGHFTFRYYYKAVDDYGCLGCDNDLPNDLPSDESEKDKLLYLIQLAVCDPQEAVKGNMPSQAKAVEMIIDRMLKAKKSK